MLESVHELKIFVVTLLAKLVARKNKDSQLVAIFIRQGIQLHCWPNWLHEKTRIANLLPYLSARAFS